MSTKTSNKNGKAARVHFERKKVVSALNPVGVTGLKSLGGIIQEEYLQEIKSWDKLSKEYLQMIDDITVGTLLDAISLPILNAGVEVVPGGETPADEQAAEWVEQCMYSMRGQTWYSHMEDMLEAVAFGFALSEIIMEKREDGRVYLKKLAPRGQETLYKWLFDDDGEVEAFVQRDPNRGDMIELPLAKCIHTIFKGRKGNPMGRGILRSVRRIWRQIHDLENLEVIGMERDIAGMPIAELGDNMGLSSEEFDKLKEGLQALRNDEAAYAIAPSGVTIKPYQGTGKMFDWRTVIDAKKKEMLGRFYAQFLKLGMEKVGTQALVKGSQDFFTLAVGAVQECLNQSWNQQLVPYMFYYSPVQGITDYPAIRCLPVGSEDMDRMMKTYDVGVKSGAINPIDEDEDKFREMMELPELPDEERGMPRGVEQPSKENEFE